MKNQIILLCILLLTNNLIGQNQIQNGGFEDYKISKIHMYIKNAKCWSIPNNSTPDLICNQNTLGVVSFYNRINFDIRNGNASMRLILFSLIDTTRYKELATNSLLSTLSHDSLYCFKAYVKTFLHSAVTIDKIQILFSEKKLKFESWQAYNPFKDDKHLIDVGNGGFFTNKYNWVAVSGIYKATGDENFLTIGNFQNYNLNNKFYFTKPTQIDKMHADWCFGAYFIDDISLTPISDSSECDCNIKRVELETIITDSVEEKPTKDSIIFKEGTRIKLSNLEFDFGSYNIKQESFQELDNLEQLLNKYPYLKIAIQGYTDNVGSEKSNLFLSENRSKAVVDYLIQKGISKERLSYKGYGSDNPIVSNETEEGRAINRRVEFEVIH